MLLYFSADRHRNCLQALKNALKKPQQKITKCDVQSVVAVHLFAPLVANSSIKVDETSYKKSSVKPECPFCHAIVPTGDTSIGKLCP